MHPTHFGLALLASLLTQTFSPSLLHIICIVFNSGGAVMLQEAFGLRLDSYLNVTEWEILPSGGVWQRYPHPIQLFISVIDGSDLYRTIDDSDLYAIKYNPSRLCRDERLDWRQVSVLFNLFEIYFIDLFFNLSMWDLQILTGSLLVDDRIGST